jgi:hypothetical protein
MPVQNISQKRRPASWGTDDENWRFICHPARVSIHPTFVEQLSILLTLNRP